MECCKDVGICSTTYYKMCRELQKSSISGPVDKYVYDPKREIIVKYKPPRQKKAKIARKPRNQTDGNGQSSKSPKDVFDLLDNEGVKGSVKGYDWIEEVVDFGCLQFFF